MTTPLPMQITDSVLADIRGIRHAFFTRQGGVSQGVYGSLNMGYGSGDEREAITENRRRAMAAIDLPLGALNTVYQEHGTEVAKVRLEGVYFCGYGGLHGHAPVARTG